MKFTGNEKHAHPGAQLHIQQIRQNRMKIGTNCRSKVMLMLVFLLTGNSFSLVPSAWARHSPGTTRSQSRQDIIAAQSPCETQSCKAEVINISTGFNYFAGTTYSAGQQDGYWTLVDSPDPSDVLPKPATVVNFWAPALPGSNKWISANPSASGLVNPYDSNDPNNTVKIHHPYSFQWCFCTCKDSILKFSFDLKADDNCEVFFDGSKILPTPATSNHYALAQQVFAGKHCLRIDVRNTGGVVGLDVQGTISSSNASLLKPTCRCTEAVKPECCDKLVVSPYPDDDLTLKYRTFEIYNFKSPPSPICYVDIALNPVPPIGSWQGGGLYINSGSGLTFIPPATMFFAPYNRIPTIGNISAVSNNASTPAVKFNIGIDFSQPYTGTVTLTVHHCDGSICTLTYGPWHVGPPIPKNPNIVSPWKVTASNTQSELVPIVLSFQGGKKSDKSARWMSVQLRNPDAEIFAVNNPELGDAQDTDPRLVRRRPVIGLKSSSKRGKSALFEFSTPLNIGATDYTGATLNVVVKKGAGADFKPDLILTLYDDNGDVIVSGPPQR